MMVALAGGTPQGPNLDQLYKFTREAASQYSARIRWPV